MPASSRALKPVPLLILVGSSSAMADRAVVLEQPALAFSLVTRGEDGATRSQRVAVGAIAETLLVSSGHAVAIERNEDVPAILEDDGDAVVAWLVLSRAKGTADPTGRAILERECDLIDSTGVRLARIRFHLELDLLGLGEEPARVSVRRFHVIGFDGLAGPLLGATLVRAPVLAVPAAPLEWWAPAGALSLDSSTGKLDGTLVLRPGLTPAAFAERSGGGLVHLTVYTGQRATRHSIRVRAGAAGDAERWQGNSSPAVHGLAIVWRESGGVWRGVLEAALGGGTGPSSVDRVSLRLGDPQTGATFQAVTIASRDADDAEMVWGPRERTATKQDQPT